VRQDLSADQWNGVEAGVLTAPSGISYTRRTTRMKRKDATTLVEAGCPVVTYWPGGLPEMTG
jgi:predicted alpha/beta hydrolase